VLNNQFYRIDSKESPCFSLNYEIATIDLQDEREYRNFTNFLCKACTKTLRLIPKYKRVNGERVLDGLMYPDMKINGKQESIINSVVMGWSYTIDETDLFEIAADLFIKICQGHTLGNANKRFAIFFTSIFLDFFEIFLISPDDNRAIDYNYLEN